MPLALIQTDRHPSHSSKGFYFKSKLFDPPVVISPRSSILFGLDVNYFPLISGAFVCPTAVKLPFPRAACNCAVCVVCLMNKQNKQTQKWLIQPLPCSSGWCAQVPAVPFYTLFSSSCIQSPSFPDTPHFTCPVNHNAVSRPRLLPGVHQTSYSSELISTVVTPPPGDVSDTLS